MTLPTKAAVSRMTRLILVFAMVLSLVGGTLYSAQAKSIYNIKADSNVITTVEGISADTGSPVVDQILEQAGIEVGSTDVVEVTVTSTSEEEAQDSPAADGSNSAAASSFAAGVASNQVVEGMTSDAPAAESQQADGSAPDVSEAPKQETEEAQTSEKKDDSAQKEEQTDASAQEAESGQDSSGGDADAVKSKDEAETQEKSTEKSEGKAETQDKATEKSEDKAETQDKSGDQEQSKSKDKAEDKEQSKSKGKARTEDADDAQKDDAKSESADEQKSGKESDDDSSSSKVALSKAEKEEDAQSSAEQERQESDESAQEEQAPSDSDEPDESSVQVSGDKIITVTVTRPKYVTVTVDKTLTSVQLQPGDTVRDVVERLNIVLGENDLISQELDAEPDVSAPITINRVELSYFTKVKTEEHGTVRKPDPKKYIGTEYVKREGVDYQKVDTYEKKIIDGGKPIITKVKTDITEMKDEIVCYGTKVDSPSPSGLSASHNVITNRDEENGTITLSDGSTYSYYSVSDSFAATAYCGGGTTSTGRAAQVGVVAVDPSVIPYGTRMYITSGSIVYGVCVAGDTGVKGHLIDLYFNSASHCRAFGRRGITVYFLD